MKINIVDGIVSFSLEDMILQSLEEKLLPLDKTNASYIRFNTIINVEMPYEEYLQYYTKFLNNRLAEL